VIAVWANDIGPLQISNRYYYPSPPEFMLIQTNNPPGKTAVRQGKENENIKLVGEDTDQEEDNPKILRILIQTNNPSGKTAVRQGKENENNKLVGEDTD
jgi:hypothetical protein